MPISLPRPTNPADIVAVVDYLWSLAPVTMDDAYAHCMGVLISWMDGDEDPFPDPPPDDKGHRPAPPPPPPPTPVYPLGPLLEVMRACDATTWDYAWLALAVAFDDWQSA